MSSSLPPFRVHIKKCFIDKEYLSVVNVDEGISASDNFGRYIALSSDGMTAVAASRTSNYARV